MNHRVVFFLTRSEVNSLECKMKGNLWYCSSARLINIVVTIFRANANSIFGGNL